jgi:hypothetical protein
MEFKRQVRTCALDRGFQTHKSCVIFLYSVHTYIHIHITFGGWVCVSMFSRGKEEGGDFWVQKGGRCDSFILLSDPYQM